MSYVVTIPSKLVSLGRGVAAVALTLHYQVIKGGSGRPARPDLSSCCIVLPYLSVVLDVQIFDPQPFQAMWNRATEVPPRQRLDDVTLCPELNVPAVGLVRSS